jgi:hypothetical protein
MSDVHLRNVLPAELITVSRVCVCVFCASAYFTKMEIGLFPVVTMQTDFHGNASTSHHHLPFQY